MRQTNAAVPIKPFKYFYGIGTPALPFGCFVALRSLSHSFLSSCFRSGSYLCPSPHFIHYVLRFATITPRSQLSHCSITWLPASNTQSHHTAGSTLHFAKPPLQYSLGFIIASLRPSFISVGFSPPAANNFACLACLPQRRVCHGFCLNTQWLDGNQKHTPNPCILSSCLPH